MKRSPKSATWSYVWVLCRLACASLSFVWFNEAVAEGQNKEPGAHIVACSPELPTVMPGDSIELRAWTSSDTTLVEYTWTASGGQINGKGAERRWNFTGVMPGLYHATVKVKYLSGLPAACSVQVIVREPNRRPPPTTRETGRSFLQKNEAEKQGYGLYSYILLGSPPTASSRQRYLGTIEAFLHLAPKIEELEDYDDPNELNISYLPMKESADSNVSAQWALDHYDYARARVLLNKLSGDHRNGPYIISTLRPLSQVHTLSGQYLFQDLSNIPTSATDLTSWWMREFLSQAAQDNFWEERTGQQLALRLRTTVAIFAVGIPEVRQGLSTAIAWLH